jgi:hypothetical protein
MNIRSVLVAGLLTLVAGFSTGCCCNLFCPIEKCDPCKDTCKPNPCDPCAAPVAAPAAAPAPAK